MKHTPSTALSIARLLSLLLLCSTTLLFVGCSSDSADSKSGDKSAENSKAKSADKNTRKRGRGRGRRKRKQLVEVYNARIEPVVYKTTRSGTLTALNVVKIHNQEEGLIQKIPFRANRTIIKKGQLLVKIDDALLRAQLNKAVATRKLKYENYARFRKLAKRKLISEDQLIKAKTEYIIAKADEQLLKTRLDNTTIEAPFDGIITERKAERGDVVSKFSHVLTMVDPTSMVIRVSISELLVPNFKIGSPAKIRIDALGNQVFDGKVVRVYPSVDSQTKQGTLEIKLNKVPKGALLGSFCRVTLNSEPKDSLIIPFKALRRDHKGEYVFVISKGKAKRRSVRTGLRHRRFVHIRSGLKPGNQVVTKGFFSLKAGSKVEIVNADIPENTRDKKNSPATGNKSKHLVVQ